ncbi:DUF4102 domain-containing protein [Acidovorax sp. JMULE5]|uniref:tyrosine-type recombinase/integrase n=1 Tax=Acidovorax sp. JMULE5 TaxID=2518343 RepID=UPI0015A41351|nr:integrase family protein [Acidovorax sp. JMULE5]QLA80406.1 DUF4102 domain-containing protein [Acidovorax sp. JMULE5]
MARPSKNALIDFSAPQDLTHGLLERAACPQGKKFVLVKDAEKKGLRLRVTAAGGKHWQFETRVKGRLFTRALGEWPTISIADARAEAHRLRGLTEQGVDPRIGEAEDAALRAKALQNETAQAVARSILVGDVWPLYLTQGKPKRKEGWKPRYLDDLHAMVAPGGVKKKRGPGLTKPGPLHPLMGLPLASIDEDVLQVWYEQEALRGRHQAARALMMFRGFVRWCSARPDFRRLVNRDAGRSAAILENLPPVTRRTDVLGAAQVAPWWSAVEQLPNRTAARYLQALLLSGVRKEAVAALKWADVDFRWQKVTFADKVGKPKTLPLTPYLAKLLSALPKVNEYIFASTGKRGHIVDARASLAKALKTAEISHLTPHGLRRAYKQRGRSVAPHGAVDQMQLHQPSGTADGYAILPLDDLRPFAVTIETHILKLAGVEVAGPVSGGPPLIG